MNTVHPGENTENQRNQQHYPIRPARFTLSAPGGEPSRSDQIKRDDSSADIVWLMLHDRQVHRGDGHGEHGEHKYPSRQNMARRAFSKTQRNGPGGQTDGSGANMHKENR